MTLIVTTKVGQHRNEAICFAADSRETMSMLFLGMPFEQHYDRAQKIYPIKNSDFAVTISGQITYYPEPSLSKTIRVDRKLRQLPRKIRYKLSSSNNPSDELVSYLNSSLPFQTTLMEMEKRIKDRLGIKDVYQSTEYLVTDDEKSVVVIYRNKSGEIKQIKEPLVTGLVMGGFNKDAAPFLSKWMLGNKENRVGEQLECQFDMDSFGVVPNGISSAIEWVFKASNEDIEKLIANMSLCETLKHEAVKVKQVIYELKALQKSKESWQNLDAKDALECMKKMIELTSILRDQYFIDLILALKPLPDQPSLIGGPPQLGYIKAGEGFKWKANNFSWWHKVFT